MKKPFVQVEAIHPGFQIAPMIDVVFVIMLFFMAMAAAIKQEHSLNLRLPGNQTDAPDLPPNNVDIGLTEGGEITVNEDTVATSDDHLLNTLKGSMLRMKEHGIAHHSLVLVTIEAEPQASYQRVIEVLDALAAAGLSNVTFAVGSDSI